MGHRFLINSILTCVLLATGLVSGCAEKKTRLWIEPPPGYDPSERRAKKLYYQVEDIQSGKRENIMIPIEQTPDNLIVENHKSNSTPNESTIAGVTKADQQLKTSGARPTLSYLLGMQAVEGLYQNRKFTEALVQIAPLIEEYPDQVRLHMMQGTLYRKLGEKKLAYQSFQKAQRLDRGNAEIEEVVLRLQDEIGEK